MRDSLAAGMRRQAPRSTRLLVVPPSPFFLPLLSHPLSLSHLSFSADTAKCLSEQHRQRGKRKRAFLGQVLFYMS